MTAHETIWRIGLTGGIGSGKSTVARLLEQAGLPVIDTDALTHELLDEVHGPAVRAIRERFGDEMIAANGTVDRQQLAQVVFGDDARRHQLEAILHPAVDARVDERIRGLPAGTPAVVIEVPLLFEAGWEDRVDTIIVVDCPPEVQVARYVARSGASEADGWARVKSQWPRERRLAGADLVVDNSGTVEQLQKRVEEVVRKLRKRGK